MEIIDKVKRFIYDLIGTLQKATLYSAAHKIFKDSVDTTYQSLGEVFKERDELIIGIISGEIVFEKEIFFELSSFDLAKKMLVFFQEKGIDRIVFYPELTQNELEMKNTTNFLRLRIPAANRKPDAAHLIAC